MYGRRYKAPEKPRGRREKVNKESYEDSTERDGEEERSACNREGPACRQHGVSSPHWFRVKPEGDEKGSAGFSAPDDGFVLSALNQ